MVHAGCVGASIQRGDHFLLHTMLTCWRTAVVAEDGRRRLEETQSVGSALR